MLFSDKRKQADGLLRFFENLGKISAKVGEKLATNVQISRESTNTQCKNWYRGSV